MEWGHTLRSGYVGRRLGVAVGVRGLRSTIHGSRRTRPPDGVQNCSRRFRRELVPRSGRTHAAAVPREPLRFAHRNERRSTGGIDASCRASTMPRAKARNHYGSTVCSWVRNALSLISRGGGSNSTGCRATLGRRGRGERIREEVLRLYSAR